VTFDPGELGRRLQEHRRAQGMTQQTVADRLATSRSNVAAFEAGGRRLSPGLIVDLASAYGLDVSDLVRSPSPIPRLTAQFRLPAEAPAADRTALEAALSQLEELVGQYLRLEDLLGAQLSPLPAPPYELLATRAAGGEHIAEAERRRLGLGDGPIESLRDLLERDLGVRSFSLVLPGSVGGLFGVSPTAGPCVAINAGHPATRQRWTLAHELAHALVHRDRPEVTRIGGYKRVPDRERVAEEFAASFLMPRSGLERRLRELTMRRPDVSVADLLVLSHEYGVSAQALVLRLEGLAIVPAGEWDRLAATHLERASADRTLGLSSRAPDRDKFPRRYMLLAMEAYSRDLLTEREFAKLVDLDRLSLRAFLDQFSQTFSEQGESIEEVQLHLDGTVGVDVRPHW